MTETGRPKIFITFHALSYVARHAGTLLRVSGIYLVLFFAGLVGLDALATFGHGATSTSFLYSILSVPIDFAVAASLLLNRTFKRGDTDLAAHFKSLMFFRIRCDVLVIVITVLLVILAFLAVKPLHLDETLEKIVSIGVGAAPAIFLVFIFQVYGAGIAAGLEEAKIGAAWKRFSGYYLPLFFSGLGFLFTTLFLAMLLIVPLTLLEEHVRAALNYGEQEMNGKLLHMGFSVATNAVATAVALCWSVWQTLLYRNIAASKKDSPAAEIIAR